MNIGKHAVILGLAAFAVAALGLFLVIEQPAAAASSDSDQGLITRTLGF